MDDELSVSTPRRSQRHRKLSVKALQNVGSSKKTKSVFQEANSTSDDFEFEPSEEADKNREKPLILHDNETLAGDQIFSFQKRKKVEIGCKPNQVPKTPHTVRNKIQKGIRAKILEDNDSSDLDFSDSGSEYLGESEKEESESASSSESIEEKLPVLSSNNKIKPKLSQTCKKLHKSYTIKTDDYFSNHSSKKILTSNHTLDKLETPRLPQDQLQKLLSKIKLEEEHENATMALSKSNRACFEKWFYLMHENINILLYGLGSKKAVLSSFHEEYLRKLPTIVVNGFFPSLTIKDVLDGIILDLLELKDNPVNIYECCELIEREFSYIPETHLYIIVHNIDMMRNSKSQGVFARLAAVNNIHLIASIDHINAPLIWDVSKLSKFNFTWWDVTTFHPYIDETSFESSMMVQRTGNLALSSLRNVFLSLTSNSKGIYLILVKYQIENSKKQYYQGLAFKELYSQCRESFLVSSDLALRAQLTEFVDHKMVKFKRSPDGTEYLIIPTPNTVLQQFVNEQ